MRKHLRFTGDMRRAYFIGKYLYVTDPYNEDIKYINVRGIFDRPLEVESIKDDGTSLCIQDDDQYPMPEYYMNDITERIMRIELGILLRMPNDELNDSREKAVGEAGSR